LLAVSPYICVDIPGLGRPPIHWPASAGEKKKRYHVPSGFAIIYPLHDDEANLDKSGFEV